jgi:hypothetical protein
MAAVTELAADCYELRAEIERLRAALEEIAGLKGEDLRLADGCGFDNLAAWKAAAALQEK